MSLAIVVTVGAAACEPDSTTPADRSQIADITAKFAQAAASVTGQDAPIADAYEEGHYVGFDTHTYPGTAVMHAWKETPGSPYAWVGFYLPSPCHADKSWTGKRDTLQAMGWGLAVVYVGQQTWGKTPRRVSEAQRAALRKRGDCASDLVSADEGTRNADDAVARASAENFEPGIVVFLDLERVEKVPAAMRDYYRAWTARMLATGKYRPGIYTHEHNAQLIFNDVQEVFRAAGDTSAPRFWIAGGKGFDEGRAPQDVGFAFAGMWQGVIDVARSVANMRLPVDVNVASWASPSGTGVSVQ
ncbi:MAG TPA: glycoside hydrolase domain-containing protein [Gemmatimonadaceae bacterium]|nr:glycoside hydrolase domain-containing protein [Gemmatimonadaceae bacterium]